MTSKIILALVVSNIVAFSPIPLPNSRFPSLLKYKTGEDEVSALESSILDASSESKKVSVFPPGLGNNEETNGKKTNGKGSHKNIGIILHSDEKADGPTLSEIVTTLNKTTVNEGELILPFTSTDKESTESKNQNLTGSKSGIFSKIKLTRGKLRKLRPSTKFRIRLGFSTIAVLLIWGQVVPWTRLFEIGSNWFNHRGFQGLAAMGRSVTYGWALFVAYPRMLDRRASERRRNEQQKAIEQRRDQLTRVSGQVARLRQELLDIDAEIRAFRREIISLKAYAKEGDPDVQEAIHAEMSHLAQLRSSKQAALATARQVWAEVKAKSPPESWDLHDPELLTP
mmetsp:Transcript_25097/g.37090  ORF Transcript_25097/g.37090 Transcript_25097/m.37090 type:complete len:340 (-) Transcript_25097:44-1063(-)